MITNLGTLGGKESEAYAINDRGQIVGEHWSATEWDHAVRWTLKR